MGSNGHGNGRNGHANGKHIGQPRKTKRPLSLTRLLNDALMLPDEVHGNAAKRFVNAVIRHAESGNASVIKEVFERIDGKVADKLAGFDGGPIKLASLRVSMDAIASDPEAREALKIIARRQMRMPRLESDGDDAADNNDEI